MIVLHGSWCPGAQGERRGAFYLWAETGAGDRGPARAIRLSAYRVRPHPGQISVRQVHVAWERLAPHVDLPTAESGAVVWLPSSDGRPHQAPELQAFGGQPGRTRRAVLAAWEVGAIAATPGQAMRLLAILPETAAQGWREVVLGSDLQYWSQAAKLALEILARQQYLPILRHDDGRFGAAWMPHADDGVRERALRLARAMPPLCRAMRSLPAGGSRVRVTPANLPAPPELLDSLLSAAVDEAIRCWGQLPRRRNRPRTDDPAQEWCGLLLQPIGPSGAAPALQAPAHRLAALYERYQAWMGELKAAQDGGCRICFRLEQPEASDEADAGQVGPESWTLRYLLQASDDPSLLVPAEVVWRESGRALNYLNRRFEQPQERLLAGLGQASRLFPALEKSLQAARPAASRLSTAEAYGFLRDAAPLLEAAGFGLLVPPWWNRRGARLGLRLHVSPAQASSSAGMLGMGSLAAFNWQLSLGEQDLSLEEFRRLAELKVPLVRVRGQWVELHPDQVEAILRFWREQARAGERTLGEALHLAQAAAEGSADTPLPVLGVSASGWIGELLRRLSGKEPWALLQAPAGFHGQLRPYQVAGLSWLAFLRRFGLGACLADDMGLGKTIQLLALLLANREEGGPRPPSLLICPTSAVGNWQREAARFAPSLRVLVHHGSERQSGPEFAAEAGRQDLVISTYSLLHRDEEWLSAVPWEGIILDEAQNVKNPGTRQAQAARRLPSRYRVALTGTPVENRLAELWSIVDFLNPGYLGSQAGFRRRFGLPIERYQDPAALRELKALVRPFILRRVKTDPQVIRDLPEKLEMPVYCQLTQEQATLYQAVVNDALTRIAESEGMQRRGLVLATLLKLKQICNHPAQFLGDGSSLPGRSGKLARLTEMLAEAVDAGDRALVFTQYAEMGELLRRHLQAELQREVLYLHGGVPRLQRERMIQRFQDDPQGPQVFLLSLKAGGTALNLMRANHVFHFDRWWNPAVENQATDRAYRIGQTRRVQVHKFVCLGTLEERIEELIESKKELAENVVDAGEGWLTELDGDQLRDLLVLRGEAVEG